MRISVIIHKSSADVFLYLYIVATSVDFATSVDNKNITIKQKRNTIENVELKSASRLDFYLTRGVSVVGHWWPCRQAQLLSVFSAWKQLPSIWKSAFIIDDLDKSKVNCVSFFEWPFFFHWISNVLHNICSLFLQCRSTYFYSLLNQFRLQYIYFSVFIKRHLFVFISVHKTKI